MAKLVIVKGDPVQGTDTHNITGTTSVPSSYVGTADYAYDGTVSAQLSDFVRIDGVPVAVVSSHSALDSAQTAPGGKHDGPSGSNPQPAAPPPDPPTMKIVDAPLGDGVPSSGTGSTFVKIGAAKVLLDADSFDTCGVPGGKASSTVAAQGQDFVSCSA